MLDWLLDRILRRFLWVDFWWTVLWGMGARRVEEAE